MTLDEEIKRYTDNAEYERTHGNLQGCLDFRQLAELLKELKQLREQTRWILCSERLPKRTGYYICTCRDGVRYRTSVLKWQTGWVLTGARSYWKVIAWMPLPPNYQGE